MSDDTEFSREDLENALSFYPSSRYGAALRVLIAAAKKHLETMPKPPAYSVRCWPSQGAPMSVFKYDTFSEARRKLTEMMDHRECWACEIRRDPR